MGQIAVSIRLDNGELAEWDADEGFLLRYRQLTTKGILGGALMRELVDVDPAHPPLSMRLSGVDDTGETLDALICYAD